jgi:hypothetical protein
VIVGVTVGTTVAVWMDAEVGVSSPSPPSQAGSGMSNNKLNTVNKTNHRFT